MFSQISTNSGTTIAHDLKRAFKFSGNSVLPAYPGFMVMKNPTVSYKPISPSSMKMNFCFFSFRASRIVLTWVEMTDNTSMAILLNSSKHPQAPDCERPIKIYAMESLPIWSEQLNTMTGRPTALPKSLVVSVFPVPAGPAGAPPMVRLRA